ncbi:hypothetical protein M5D96_005327 [Drosophila gunungcola]|uniref:Caprin-1 dimerization domain-containing protein n=1 Tax=Drosophila gunungcola TaxID=103775 RepID=A0A9Q0BR28_9MUSC|nr:hypothetical protein M5D96_005327 [Drosophila gunungcola]
MFLHLHFFPETSELNETEQRLNIIPHFELKTSLSQPGRSQRRTMPSAANSANATTTATAAAATAPNNNSSASKEKRSSISSLGGSGAGAAGAAINGQNNNSGSIGGNLNAAEGSQTDLANSNNNNASNGNAAKSKATAPELYNPLKQMLVTIEHKIRNLEKRKTKLESYRAIQSGGKELSGDQASAVAKYDAVLANLEFAREMSKHIQQQSKEAEKEQKKQARKDNLAKAIAETIKIREVLIMQNVINCFNDEQVRNDFLAGENGATKLDSSDLDVLEKFCIESQTRRPETADDVSFITTAQKSAELFSSTINARPKSFGEMTFEKLRALFQKIQDCGYLDKYYLVPLAENAVANSTDSGTGSGDGEGGDLLNDGSGELDTELPSEPSARNSLEEGLDKLHLGVQTELEQHQQHQQQQERPGHHLLEQQHQRAPSLDHQQQTLVVQQQQQQQPPPPPQQQVYQAPPPARGTTTPVHVLYAPAPPPQQQPQQPPPHPHQLLSSPVNLQALQTGAAAPPPQQQQQQQPHPTHFAPNVRAVEQNYFKQPPPHPQAPGLQAQPTPQQQQFMQQLRPLAEVLGTGSFHFLQDSELDNPEALAPPPPTNQGLVFEQQPPQPNHVEEPPQAIQTLTFTNQSFPSQQPKPQQQAPAQQQLFSPGEATPPAPPTKWSSEMNAMSSAASNGSSNTSHKQEWATPRDHSAGGYADNDGNNHWNNSQGEGRRNSGNYQRRGGDRDNRDRDQGGRGDERRNGGDRGNYRSRQYGNSSNPNGRNSGNSGVYFRNNESGNGGGNSYYQNGGGGGGTYNKESRYENSGGGGGSYRGQRGGNQQRNVNGSYGGGRPMGDRGRGGAGNQGGGGYINRQNQSQRMPLGLENKN